MAMEELALPGFQSADHEPRLVAQVYVDTDFPHLDRPLDYIVPKRWENADLTGCIVRVPLAGSKRTGWVFSCERQQVSGSTMRELDDVVSPVPVVQPQTFTLARYIADRFLSTMSAVLSLAVPSRRASVEKLDHSPTSFAMRTSASTPIWSAYEHGLRLLEHLENGDNPRCVWSAIPGCASSQIADLVRATAKSFRSTLIVAPTQREADALAAELEEELGVCVPVYGSELSSVDRYRLYREVQAGVHRLLVGTRSAIWLPVSQLGLIVVWGDGDDHLREIRSPRTDVLDVVVARAHLEHVALAVGNFSRSVKAQYLVARQWAISLVPDRSVLREYTGRFFVADSFDDERQGRAARSFLPPDAHTCIRRGLASGPVLVLVPNAGYIPVVGCQRCGAPARCQHCCGPLTISRDQAIECSWCHRSVGHWRCLKCQGTSLRWWRIGSERIGEELGRSFAQVPLLISQGDTDRRSHVDSSPRIVVATAGAEPRATHGYAALIIANAASLASRPELWAPEEALRRWFTAASLVRPHGQIWVSSGLELSMAQALIRWNPEEYIQRLLDEREVLRFPPTSSIVAIDGPLDQLKVFCEDLPAELIGIVEAPTNDKRKLTEQTQRALIRCASEDYQQLAHVLKERAGVRSARKLLPLRLTLNPPELF